MMKDVERITSGERAGRMLNAILEALESESFEVSARVMRSAGVMCATLPCPPAWGVSLHKALEISQKSESLEERVAMLNRDIPWCGEWSFMNGTISSECDSCGCLLVQDGLVSPSGIWCACSLGWVEAIFAALLQCPVRADLVSAIGRGDATCKYIVHLSSE